MNIRVKLVPIKNNFILAGLSKLNSIMVSISEVFEVRTTRWPARREPCCQISTFQVYRGLQVHHSTLESIGMSTRRKFVVFDWLIFLKTKYLGGVQDLSAAMG